MVYSNLELVFPEKTPLERKQIAKAFYQHLCDIIFETIKNLTISEKEITQRFKFENLELLDTLYKKDKSVLLMCAHYASWEWSGILGKFMDFKGVAVYKKINNQYFDRLVKKIRGRFGATIVANTKIVPTLFRNFKKGEKTCTLILSDQTPRVEAAKHRDTFMDIDVPVFTGSEELAKRLDFAVVYLKVEKVKRGYYSATFVPLTEDPKSIPDYQLTRMFLTEIEKQIKEAPAYYLWSHKRWKHRAK